MKERSQNKVNERKIIALSNLSTELDFTFTFRARIFFFLALKQFKIFCRNYIKVFFFSIPYVEFSFLA